MEIKKSAVAGTLESSDAMVTVEPNEGHGIEFELKQCGDPSVWTQHPQNSFTDT